MEKKQLIAEVGQEDYDSYYKDELPRHEVCVDGFWMGKYEVTNAEYVQHQIRSENEEQRSIRGLRRKKKTAAVKFRARSADLRLNPAMNDIR